MFTVGHVLDATGGRLLAGGRMESVEGVSTDSRTIRAGQLFVALHGPRFDGHDFVVQAMAPGRDAAGALIVPSRFRGAAPPGRILIGVEDTLLALQALARAHRSTLSAVPLAAVTGSNGKTTTKEMAAGILARRFTVLKNEGNLNNTIGVPLTLLRLTPAHQAAVIEMGISEPGELLRLCEVALPTLGLITNIGRAHLETLGDLEGVARAKGELLEGLRGGLAILNADDPSTDRLAQRATGPVMTFGFTHDADIRASDLRPGNIFTLTARGDRSSRGEVEVRLSVPGLHNVLNAAAAAAIATAFQVDLRTITRGLEAFSPVRLRTELIEWRGLRILNDAYNANPDSMRAALVTLAGLKGTGRAVAVLGDMLELGPHAPQAHREAGEAVARLGIEGLILLGDYADLVADGARAGGMPSDRIRRCASHEEAETAVQQMAGPGDVILVKGSRRMKMEKIVEALLAA